MTAKRKDDKGKLWTEERVEREVRRIVAKLAPGHRTRKIKRETRFTARLGWDEWYRLRLIGPVKSRLHETLTAWRVKRLRTVGELADYVWSKMEEI